MGVVKNVRNGKTLPEVKVKLAVRSWTVKLATFVIEDWT